MAITSKYVEVGGRTLIKHESDSGKMIRQIETGREYSSAIDVIPCKYTYEETEKDIKITEAEYEEILRQQAEKDGV